MLSHIYSSPPNKYKSNYKTGSHLKSLQLIKNISVKSQRGVFPRLHFQGFSNSSPPEETREFRQKQRPLFHSPSFQHAQMDTKIKEMGTKQKYYLKIP